MTTPGTSKAKFRYEKRYLMLFQNVFVDKPSENWSRTVKETIGRGAEAPVPAHTSARTATYAKRLSEVMEKIKNLQPHSTHGAWETAENGRNGRGIFSL